MRRYRSAWAVALAGTALVLVRPAQAQDRDAYRLPTPPSLEAAARGSLVSPAIGIGVPTGFGADFGDVFAGVGFQSRTRFRDKMDGGAVAGLGLGDARKYLGLEVMVNQYGTARSCCRGALSFKAHRLLPGAASVAVGWENATGWGNMEGETLFTDGGESVYAVASKVFFLRPGSNAFNSVTASVGVGNGRYRTEDDVLDEEDRANVFGSLGVRVLEPLSVVGSWTGQDLNAGVSVVPIPRAPIVLTFGMADLTTEPRFIAGAGLGFSYHF